VVIWLCDCTILKLDLVLSELAGHQTKWNHSAHAERRHGPLVEQLPMDSTRILISGGGIAGLTLAIELKRRGFDPLVIEKEPGLRREGYMMDFFGTGWDVAARMGLVDQLRAIRYPIDALEFVDRSGEP
jgi:hypothetical protein